MGLVIQFIVRAGQSYSRLAHTDLSGHIDFRGQRIRFDRQFIRSQIPDVFHIGLYIILRGLPAEGTGAAPALGGNANACANTQRQSAGFSLHVGTISPRNLYTVCILDFRRKIIVDFFNGNRRSCTAARRTGAHCYAQSSGNNLIALVRIQRIFGILIQCIRKIFCIACPGSIQTAVFDVAVIGFNSLLHITRQNRYLLRRCIGAVNNSAHIIFKAVIGSHAFKSISRTFRGRYGHTYPGTHFGNFR